MGAFSGSMARGEQGEADLAERQGGETRRRGRFARPNEPLLGDGVLRGCCHRPLHPRSTYRWARPPDPVALKRTTATRLLAAADALAVLLD